MEKIKIDDIENTFKNYTRCCCLELKKTIENVEKTEIDEGNLIVNTIVYLGIFILESSKQKYGKEKAEQIFDLYISNSLELINIYSEEGLQNLNGYMVERNSVYTDLINKLNSTSNEEKSFLENPIAALGKSFSEEVVNDSAKNAFIYISVSAYLSQLIKSTYKMIDEIKINF